MTKLLKYDEEALKAMLSGVKTLAKAVAVTLGPKGRNVVIKKEYGSPLSTKDGVTVAKEIYLKDKFENMGAQLVKEASSKTCDLAGDGTTTAVVLAEAILSLGIKNVIAGCNPMSLKKGIEEAVKHLISALNAQAIEVKSHNDIKQVAAISANNDPEIGELIAQAMEKIGKDGAITIAEAKGIETILDIVEGLQFDRGYLSPYFITNAQKMSVEFDNPSILLIDHKVSTAKDLVPVLEKIMEEKQRPLLIIAEDLDGEALSTLVINKIKAGLPVCAVKAPGFGDKRKELMEDIATITGATLISKEVGLSLTEVGTEVLGTAKSVKIDKEKTTIVDGLGNKQEIEKRKAQIRKSLFEASSDQEKQQLQERLSKLSGGVGILRIGAATETELKEKKARVEDALQATKAAVIEGIVVGGGVALIKASKELSKVNLEGEMAIGVDIVKEAAFAPAIAIANNCGQKGVIIAEKILDADSGFGYNGLSGEFENLKNAGVMDPVLVTKSALKNAASIAALLITAAAMITDKAEAKSERAHPGMNPSMGMGGMGPMGGMM